MAMSMDRRIKNLGFQIGVTDYCNLRCKMCVQGNSCLSFKGNEKKGFMDFETWKIIIDKIQSSKVFHHLLMIWIGESLLHPELLKFIEYAYKNNKARTLGSLVIYTNCTALDKDFSDSLIKLSKKYQVKSELVFSLHGNTPQTFKQITGFDIYEKVIKNVEYFIKTARVLDGFNYTGVTIQIIVMKENFHELIDFYKRWQVFLNAYNINFGVYYDYYSQRWDKYRVKISFVREGNRSSLKLLQKNEELHKLALIKLGLIDEGNKNKRVISVDSKIEENKHQVRWPCPSLFDYCVVNWDGRVTICCSDFDMSMSYADFKKDSIEEILDGEIISRYRMYHLEGKFEYLDDCSRCGNFDSPNLRMSEIYNYLKRKNVPKEKIKKILKRLHF